MMHTPIPGVMSGVYCASTQEARPMRRRCLFIWVLACLSLAGCVAKPRDPRPAVFRYPYASLAGLRDAAFVRYEGKDVGLDGGSAVYILSTPGRKKVALWNFCTLAKRERGYDLVKNAFMLETGARREDEHPIEAGGELEALLIERLSAGLRRKEAFPYQHRTETEIIAALQDRHHVLNTPGNSSP